MNYFYWCYDGCNTYHDSRTQNGFHYLMVPHAPEDPSPSNFPGTEEELKRFKAYLRVVKRDQEDFERRVDEELKNVYIGEKAYDE